MRGLSEDLRERVVRRYESGKEAEEVAAHFEVSVRSVYRYVKLARAGKSLVAQKPGGKRSMMEREGLHDRIRTLVNEDSEASLAVYVKRLEAQTGVVMSVSSMYRALRQLDLTLKKRRNELRSATRRVA